MAGHNSKIKSTTKRLKQQQQTPENFKKTKKQRRRPKQPRAKSRLVVIIKKQLIKLVEAQQGSTSILNLSPTNIDFTSFCSF